MPEKRYYATGKRKTAVARVWIKQGAGQFVINGRTFEDYFPLEEWRLMVNRPFVITENSEKFDVVANIYGGGIPAQAWALGHGIAKALLEFNSGLRGLLKNRASSPGTPGSKKERSTGRRLQGQASSSRRDRIRRSIGLKMPRDIRGILFCDCMLTGSDSQSERASGDSVLFGRCISVPLRPLKPGRSASDHLAQGPDNE